MRIGIAGGTGAIGRRLATALLDAGHEARALSRRAPEYPVDLMTGGLEAALEGCEVVIDASDGSSSSEARRVVEGSRRMLAAEQRACVTHHVCEPPPRVA
jgi:uncharacterized protein YbjT (DUF2867 family)